MSAPSLANIIHAVSAVTGVAVEDIKGERRERPVSAARRLYCVAAHRLSRRPLTAIGLAINVDHTTVIHHIRAARSDPSLVPDDLIDAVQARLPEQQVTGPIPIVVPAPKPKVRALPPPSPRINVAEVKRLRSLGWSYLSLARRYNVSETEVAIALGHKLEDVA